VQMIERVVTRRGREEGATARSHVSGSGRLERKRNARFARNSFKERDVGSYRMSGRHRTVASARSPPRFGCQHAPSAQRDSYAKHMAPRFPVLVWMRFPISVLLGVQMLYKRKCRGPYMAPKSNMDLNDAEHTSKCSKHFLYLRSDFMSTIVYFLFGIALH
jgi:hypothetical protein